MRYCRAVPPSSGLVVQCTSLGLRAGDPLPLDAGALAGAAHVLDLVYPDTEFVRAARAAGVRADGGLGLLVHQGALSVQRWLGRVPDVGVMRAAAEAELRRRG